jgi:transcriptional regulator with XRE-family HTH domain
VETPRTVLENIGRRIIEIRIARGWTQETCAEKLWVDVRLLRRIEGGRHNLTIATLVRLAQRLEIPTSVLFDASQLEDARRPGRRRLIESAPSIAVVTASSTASSADRSRPPYSPPGATAAHPLGEKGGRRPRPPAPRRAGTTKK